MKRLVSEISIISRSSPCSNTCDSFSSMYIFTSGAILQTAAEVHPLYIIMLSCILREYALIKRDTMAAKLMTTPKIKADEQS